ncbi:MAG: ERF family protein [Syntrophaceae bacterium]
MNGELQTIEPQAPCTPMLLLQMAVGNNANMDTIERLVALQEHMMEQQAKVEFASAMSRAQAAMGRVSADGTNPQTHSKYATYAAMDRELRPIYSREGFALSFDTGEGITDTIRIFCHVSHSGGHTRTYQVDMPNDGKGAKGGDVMTKTHATGSAMSYGMRYLLKMIFNVAIGEADNDGNTFGMDEPAFQAHLKAIREAKTIDELQKVYATAYTAAAKDKPTQAAIIKAKDERKGELRGAK